MRKAVLSVIILICMCVHAYAGNEIALQQAKDLARSGKIDEAIKAFDQLIATNPKDADLYMMRGYLYNKKNDLEHAIADYSKTIELNPRDGNAYYNRGFNYLFKKQYPQSLADMNKAIELGVKVDPTLLEGLKKAYGQQPVV